MKHIIILGDGMADHPIQRLGSLTPLQYADTPYMDRIAREGKTGRLVTIPDGFQPGSEVANTAILGYDLQQVYEGRGPLEAASIGYDMRPDDLALRCNIITLGDGKIRFHHGGHLTTEEGDRLIQHLNSELGNDRVHFITGIQYRHLLVIHGGSKHIVCAPPHDHPNEAWEPLLVKPEPDAPVEPGRMTAAETAALINELILRSQQLLSAHPFNRQRPPSAQANSIWPWSGGYRPSMQTLPQRYPQIKHGSVVSAVDLIRGIGHYAGLRRIVVEGATGMANTNYEGKAEAAIRALRDEDFVFLHIEASDEAGHDGDLELKLQTIEYLDRRIVRPVLEAIDTWDEAVSVALLPDHPTPVEIRTHVGEPVPFAIWHKGIEADDVQRFDEVSCMSGSYGLIRLQQFMDTFMNE